MWFNSIIREKPYRCSLINLVSFKKINIVNFYLGTAWLSSVCNLSFYLNKQNLLLLLHLVYRQVSLTKLKHYKVVFYERKSSHYGLDMPGYTRVTGIYTMVKNLKFYQLKINLGSDFSLKFTKNKMKSLVIVHKLGTMNFFLTLHTPPIIFEELFWF